MARSKYEIKAHKELQESGHKVDYKARPFRVPKGYQVDYFGLFDLLAYDPETKSLRCIAIKGHMYVPSELRRAIEDFTPERLIREIWVYKPDKTIKREIIGETEVEG